jgi:hypothetical protein
LSRISETACLTFHFNSVFFRGVTWQRDSHGLFDYESRNISKKNLKTQYTGKIIRQLNSIEFIAPTQRIEDLPGYKKEECTTLAQIKQDSSKFSFLVFIVFRRLLRRAR